MKEQEKNAMRSDRRLPAALSVLCRAILVTTTLVLPALAEAAIYPLELVSPRAAGTSPAAGYPALSANNRIFWAYPGLEYNIRATVIGGTYPYTFSLADAPDGMSINAATGEIRWVNPSGTGATPRISVTDSEGTTVSSAWTITVDPDRFIFLDAVNGREFDGANPGTGTRTNPFRRIRDLYSGNTYESKRVNTHAHKIAYFRTGTYNIDGFIEDVSSTSGGRMALLDSAKPVAWVAYPGELPTIDGRCVATSPQIGSRPCNWGPHIAIYDSANNTYIDGFRLINMAFYAFRTAGSGNYQVFRRNRFSVNGPTIEGVNQGFITTMNGETGYYMSVQDNVFENIEQGSCIKLYATARILIEDNICRNVRGGESEGIAAKGGTMDRVTIRHNIVHGTDRSGIGGNMHVLRSGEILFNRVYDAGSGTAVDINQDGLAGPVYLIRNTVVGRFRVRNTDSADGPFFLYNNVVVNNDPGQLTLEGVSDTSRVRTANNLTGTPSQSIVDVNLNLTTAYQSYLGTHGHQITGSSSGSYPSAPRNLRITPP